eukprot:CAMPEP_0202686988 /NCGR_PEP_ID=MMETSP1385-20130828/2712_1 /ASSEMBLY_ACC=CAM_ASM_000861 /TAXON_ID=933848 /ORGANISM="Elphidium margaritaceum" /LENGTH=548 /DNA_ID=CAMNT_0049341689 /DNA_START=29 /DNA_END=1675 /DNA_ORIENTATION=-
MQAHVRHVEKLANFMSPVGLSISHYNSHPSKRQRFNNLTAPPNVTGDTENSEHMAPSHTTHASHPVAHASPPQQPITNANVATQPTTAVMRSRDTRDTSWARENLSLRHSRNRSMYFEAESTAHTKQVMNSILDKLVIYGYETSADIAKMQPWQLRVLKKEIAQIDYIFMTAYRMWGQRDIYDDQQNLTYRQYWDPSVWLQYNEIELIVQCFDGQRRGYECMICRTRHGLYELDQLRWHIWLEHKQSTELSAIIEASKAHNAAAVTRPLQHLQVPSRAVAPKRDVISLLDDSTEDDDDEDGHEAIAHTTARRRHKYQPTARPYSSRRPKKRTRSTAATNSTTTGRASSETMVAAAAPIQNPIIVNGANDASHHAHVSADSSLAHHHPGLRPHRHHGAPSAPFMARTGDQFHAPQIHTPARSHTYPHTLHGQLERDDSEEMKNASSFSLDTRDSSMMMDTEVLETAAAGSASADLATEMEMGIGMDMDMEDFSMIGFKDDFSTLMGALSRNSSGSFPGAINLNSAFSDHPFTFDVTQKLNRESAAKQTQ